MTIRVTKNNGKGKRPDNCGLMLEGRNAYGQKSIAFVLRSLNVEGANPYNILNMNIEDFAEFVDELKQAYAQAKYAEDTTPEKYRVKPATVVANTQATPMNLTGITPEFIAQLQAMGFNFTPPTVTDHDGVAYTPKKPPVTRTRTATNKAPVKVVTPMHALDDMSELEYLTDAEIAESALNNIMSTIAKARGGKARG